MNKSDVESFLFSLLEQTINEEDPLCGFSSELGIEDIKGFENDGKLSIAKTQSDIMIYKTLLEALENDN